MLIKRTTTLFLIIGLAFITLSCTNKVQNSEGEEPLMSLIDSDKKDYKKAMDKAKSSLNQFIEKVENLKKDESSCVKIYIPQNEEKGGYFWLVDPVFSGDSCTATIFEIPREYQNLKPGMSLTFPTNGIKDWYILNSSGELQGGYTLRYQRSTLPKNQRKQFDDYIGVKIYLE